MPPSVSNPCCKLWEKCALLNHMFIFTLLALLRMQGEMDWIIRGLKGPSVISPTLYPCDHHNFQILAPHFIMQSYPFFLNFHTLARKSSRMLVGILDKSIPAWFAAPVIARFNYISVTLSESAVSEGVRKSSRSVSG